MPAASGLHRPGAHAALRPSARRSPGRSRPEVVVTR